jgi:hypothetical protein
MKNKKEIEKELQKLIDRYHLNEKLTVEVIKNWVFEEKGETASESTNRFHKRVFSYFKDLKDIDELNEVLGIISDTWNYFPHKSLGGKSPTQLVKEELKIHPELKKKSREMPEVIVGGRKMSWNDHSKMIKKMEELQKPFRRWVKDEVLPNYRNYLKKEKSLPKEVVEKHYEVADVFFDRAMWIGFLNFEEIRTEFAKYEFPRWWQTHVMGNDLDENEIWSSLKILLGFLTEKYGIDVKKFFNI